MDAADRVIPSNVAGPRLRQLDTAAAAVERDPLLSGAAPPRRTRVAPFTRSTGTGSSTDPSAGGRRRRGDDRSVGLNALAEQLGVTPAALEAAIQKTRQAQNEDYNAGEQPSAFDAMGRMQQRALRTAKAAQTLGVEPRSLYTALAAASDLPRGANPLQYAAQQLNADPNALMMAMQRSGLGFVDQYA